MNMHLREGRSHVREFIEVPAGFRRHLEEAIERLVDVLDQLDAPDEDLEDSFDAELSTWLENHAARASDACGDDEREIDADFEDQTVEDEDGGDAEPEEGDADLGWTLDGAIGVNDEGKDEDFVTPETSCAFGRPSNYYGSWLTYEQHTWMRAQFDPRIARRPPAGSRTFENFPIPLFPHENAGRRPFDRWGETRRLLAMAGRLRRARRIVSRKRPG